MAPDRDVVELPARMLVGPEKIIKGCRMGGAAGPTLAALLTELYLAGQSTRQDRSLFTGTRWENRFRLLMGEHRVNPVLYVELERINGADKTKTINDTTVVYTGANIRFRIVGGSFKVRVVGAGIDLSTAGRGYAILGPDPSNLDTAVTGTYSLNGGNDTSLPAFSTKLTLGSATGG